MEIWLQGGVVGSLLGVIAYLLASNRSDRAQFFNETNRLRAENARDSAAFEKRGAALEAAKDEAEKEAEDERRKRRRAEEELSRLRRQHGVPEDI